MRTEDILNNFALPDAAVNDLRKLGLSEQSLSDGVSLLSSGHDRGISYRFFVHEVRNPIKSETTGFPHYEKQDMIEWFKDDRNKPVEQVRLLPKELLSFDRFDGTCIGGLYKDAYLRFKQGLAAPGLALRRWNIIDEGSVRSLEELGIFTVEQFAAQPREKITTRFPKELQEAFQQAIEWVNGKDTREQAEKQGEQLMSVLNDNAKLSKEVEALRDQIQALIGSSEVEVPRKRARRKAA